MVGKCWTKKTVQQLYPKANIQETAIQTTNNREPEKSKNIQTIFVYWGMLNNLNESNMIHSHLCNCWPSLFKLCFLQWFLGLKEDENVKVKNADKKTQSYYNKNKNTEPNKYSNYIFGV